MKNYSDPGVFSQTSFSKTLIPAQPVISLYDLSLVVTRLLTNKPKPVAVIQAPNCMPHVDFPNSWPDEFGRFPLLVSLSRRPQMSLRAPCRLGCIHHRIHGSDHPILATPPAFI
jgi:hypothetical protein